jgi:hypothetical protein
MILNDLENNQPGQLSPPPLDQATAAVTRSAPVTDPAVDKIIESEAETRLKLYELQHGAGIRRLNNYRTRKALAILLNGKQEAWEKHHDRRGRCTDARTERFPDWQMNGCIVLLRLFEVTRDLEWRIKRGVAARYDGLWKKINRGELAHITSRFGRDYLKWAYKRRELALVFKMGAAAGIIVRRKGNWIKFNPGKFMEWLEKAEAYKKLHLKRY